MEIIQPILLSQHKYDEAIHVNIGAGIVALVFFLIMAACVFIIIKIMPDPDDKNASDNKNAKDDTEEAIMGLSAFGILAFLLAIFALMVANSANPDDLVKRSAVKTIKASSLVQGKHHNIKIKNITNDFDSDDNKRSLRKIKTTWPNQKETIVAINYTSKPRRVICTAKTKLGHAYMRVAQYIDSHAEKPVDIVWRVKPYAVLASYDDKTGHHEAVCYVDNKNVNKQNEQIVVRY